MDKVRLWKSPYKPYTKIQKNQNDYKKKLVINTYDESTKN